MVEAKVAYMFTGQGSQRKGMWGDLIDPSPGSGLARRIFINADEIADCSLVADPLTDTSKAQPAIVAHSLAALAVAKDRYPEIFKIPPAFCLGHSVGEYSALAAAGAINTTAAIYLVTKRGLLMEEAGRINPGKMAALLGLTDDAVRDICQKTGAQIANFNCPGQIVISGEVDSIEKAVELVGERKSRRLDISIASHSSLMRPAQERFANVLAPVGFREPQAPVISNVSARPYQSVAEIKQRLVEQLVSPVHWQQSIEYVLSQGVTTFIEFGPQAILTGLLRRINREAKSICISSLASLQDLPALFA